MTPPSPPPDPAVELAFYRARASRLRWALIEISNGCPIPHLRAAAPIEYERTAREREE